jgi:hypothetical protein
MKYILTVVILVANISFGISQSLPSIWRIPYSNGLLQFNVVFEFCADGRVTVIQTGPGTLPTCKVANWWRFGNELLVKSILSEMTCIINESNPTQPFLQNIQLTASNDILPLYPANTQPDAFLYAVSIAQLAAYKQIGGCPVVPQCTLVNWSTTSTNEQETVENEVKVVPNPAHEQVSIYMSEHGTLPSCILLTNAVGELIFKPIPSTFLTLEIINLPLGMYFIHFYWEDRTYAHRLIKI